MKRHPLFLLVAACFFVSGAAGLLYEVVWMRLLGLLFGHTVYAVTTVLAAYMGGLAAGSLLLGRRADRVRRPLRAYGLLEATIGAYCLATPLLFAAADRAYLALYTAVQPGPVASAAIHLTFSILLLGLPTTLMGMTLPLLSRALVERVSLAGARVGTLYAINTWGAVAGVAATGFFLLPAIGVGATVWLGVGLNLAVAAAAVLIDRWSPAAPGAPAAAPAEALAPDASPEPPAVPRSAATLALVAIGVSGAASMAYEIAWTRALSLVLGSSTYAFTAMLTTFLVGLALGALLVARLLRRRAVGLLAFGAVEVAVAVVVVAMLPLFGELPELFLRFVGRLGLSHGSALLAQFTGSFLVMIVPTLLIGATFPLVVAALATGLGTVGKDVGRVYGANTVGTILGSAGAGFVLIPLLGIQDTVIAAAAANLAAGLAVLLTAPGTGRRVRYAAAGAVACFALAAVALPRWDSKLMASGVAVYAQDYLRPGGDTGGLRDALKQRQLLFYEEGLNTTVSVTRTGEQLRLAVNGKIDGGDGADMPTQVLLAQLPGLLAPEARRALVIGLGTGVTAGSLAQHPLDQIEVAELEPAMIEAARLFSAVNHGVLADPRVKIVAGDGRHILAAAAEPYDIIISEPSNPWIAGVANLFTREFYTAARDHLAPRGVIVQWVQGYQIFPRELRMIVRTFQSVFPNATVWRGSKSDFLLVATREPIELDLPAIARRIAESPGVRADFARLRMDPHDLLQRFLLSAEDAGRFAQDAPLNTDDLPLLEFAAPRALYAFGALNENLELLRSVRRDAWPPARGVTPAELESPGWLVERARAAWLRGNPDDAKEWLERAGRLDGAPVAARLERARVLFGLTRLHEAADAFEAIVAQAPAHPVAAPYLRACRALLERDLGLALMHAIAARGGAGESSQTHEALGRALLDLTVQTGESALLPVASEQLEAALALSPSPPLAMDAVLVRLEQKQPDEALALARRAVARDGDEARAQFALGLACEAKGLRREAARALEEAARLSPDWPAPREQLRALGTGSSSATAK
jgi:spermidine synthase